jgi:hypothetical protein
VASLSLGDGATTFFRVKAKANIAVQTAHGRNQRGTKPASLKFELEHGDVMVMHGAQIQKLYEHKVEPHGKLRFALTSRCIKPELLPADQQEYARQAGTLPEWSKTYEYDGDIHAIPVIPKGAGEKDTRKRVAEIKTDLQQGFIDRNDAEAIWKEIMG